MSGQTPSFERFDIALLPAQPWKNGAGLTRAIAIEPADAGLDALDWRFSVAEVARDAPFSTFAGIDRCIVLLAGGGLRLRSADGELDHRLDEPDRPFSFAGELGLGAQVLAGPSLDFNVMTRRSRWRSEVRALRERARTPGADALLLLARRGEWEVEGAAGAALRPGQGLLWRARIAPQRLRPAADGACLLAVCLWRESMP